VPVADAFPSMSALWDALSEHERGAEPGSIWDTYESGERRRLELQLAEMYGAPDATAVCTGMTGVMNALLAASLETRSGLEEPGHCGHYEILDLFAGVLGRLDRGAEAGVRVVEPVVNDHSLRVELEAITRPARAIVVDNSLFSLSLPWEVWHSRVAAPLLVVESIPKYLCREVNGGVIFGEPELLRAVRELSRRSGTLMSRTSSVIALSSLEKVLDRLRSHAANAELFAKGLQRARPDLNVRVAHAVAQQAGLKGACSALVFAVYPPDAPVLDEFEAWAQRAGQLVGRPTVRHGYGWSCTYGRAYGANRLNARGGTEYIRFSVGLEGEDVLLSLARLLSRLAT
jgi:hypothetical protein